MDSEQKFWLCIGMIVAILLGSILWVGHKSSIRDDELRANCIAAKGIVTRDMQCVPVCKP